MPDRFVLDSSVIAAIFLQEDDDSRRAREIARSSDFITLDTAISEVGNVAWKKTVFFKENREEMQGGLQDAMAFVTGLCLLLKSSDLAERAYEISVDTGATFYDALFLAAAEREGVPLLTLDRKLYEKVKASRDVRLV